MACSKSESQADPAVTIIMGSLSDRKVGELAIRIFRELGISCIWRVASAHRTPGRVKEIMQNSDSKVFIGIAGMAAHLPGIMASHTIQPVIAVPVSGPMGGLDALLSTVQMPPGIPVATVGVGRGDNAALLAAEILALQDVGLAVRLREYREMIRIKVQAQDEELRKETG